LSGRGDGALHAASSNGDSLVVKTLLEEGADVNQKNLYVSVALI
jgi:ankyrin repeat protein